MEAILQAQKQGVVLGLKGISDTPVPRMEIDDLLFNKPDTFNLFVLAVSELQDEKLATEKMAWQQVAGIHGLSMTPWDGVKSQYKEGGAGYCVHARPTFPTWHRPYLAMMEQTIYVKMAEIVGKFPAQFQRKYQAALKEFRLPYWDYYRPRNKGTVTMPGVGGPGGTTTFEYDFALPQIFVMEQIMVRHYADNDELQPMPNPLRTFSFPKSGGFSSQDCAKAGGFSQRQTVRYPASASDLTGNLTKQSFILNREREGNVRYILSMIRDYDSFGWFASSSLTPGPSGNLENIHAAYHGYIGGGAPFGTEPGHMSFEPTAAFDPVFWMHQCLIDRWFAIWQAAHPEKWFDGKFKTQRDSFKVTAIPPLAKEDALPFRHPQGKFWNADLSQDTQTFGYIYTDAVKSSPQAVIDNFETLYSWARRRDPRGDTVSPPEEIAPVPVAEAQVFQYSTVRATQKFAKRLANEAPSSVLMALEATALSLIRKGDFAEHGTETHETADPIEFAPAAPGAKASDVAFMNLRGADVQNSSAAIDESAYHREWFVDDIVKRLALHGPFAIFYFIGRFDDEDVRNYAYQPTMAGINYVFTASREACDHCSAQDDQDVEITGTKVITPMLMDYVKVGQLRDLTPEHVVPFLEDNLKWRIVDQAGHRQDPREVAGFKVGVSSSLTPISGGGRPIYQEYPQVVEQIIATSLRVDDPDSVDKPTGYSP